MEYGTDEKKSQRRNWDGCCDQNRRIWAWSCAGCIDAGIIWLCVGICRGNIRWGGCAPCGRVSKADFGVGMYFPRSILGDVEIWNPYECLYKRDGRGDFSSGSWKRGAGICSGRDAGKLWRWFCVRASDADCDHSDRIWWWVSEKPFGYRICVDSR